MESFTARFSEGLPSICNTLSVSKLDTEGVAEKITHATINFKEEVLCNWKISASDAESESWASNNLTEFTIDAYGVSEILLLARSFEWCASELTSILLNDPDLCVPLGRFRAYIMEIVKNFVEKEEFNQSLAAKYHVTPITEEMFNKSQIHLINVYDLESSSFYCFVSGLYSYIKGQTDMLPVWEVSESECVIGNFTYKKDNYVIPAETSPEEVYDSQVKALLKNQEVLQNLLKENISTNQTISKMLTNLPKFNTTN